MFIDTDVNLFTVLVVLWYMRGNVGRQTGHRQTRRINGPGFGLHSYWLD